MFEPCWQAPSLTHPGTNNQTFLDVRNYTRGSIVTGMSSPERFRVLSCAKVFKGAGYGVVIGLGALFALGMMAVTEIMKRKGNVEDAEEFTGTFLKSCRLR